MPKPNFWYSVEYWSVPSQKWAAGMMAAGSYTDDLDAAKHRLTIFVSQTPTRRLWRHYINEDGALVTELLETWYNHDYTPQ